MHRKDIKPLPQHHLPLEQMVEAYAAMVIEKKRKIDGCGDQPLNVGQLLGSIMDAEIERRGYSKTVFKASARALEICADMECLRFQELKRQFDSRDGLSIAVAPKDRAPKPPLKVLTDEEKSDTACRALGYSLEEGKYGSCKLDRRCGSLYLSAVINYPEFMPSLMQFAHGVVQRSKVACAERKAAFRSFIRNPSRCALDALDDVELEPSRLHLSALIPRSNTTDVVSAADLERCAAYVANPACVAMALDVEKSPLSCTWKQLKPALIQIADSNCAFLLHSDMIASNADYPPIASRIFASLLGQQRTLVVFGADDLSMLRKLDFLALPAIPPCHIVDMQKLCLLSPSLTARAGSKRGLADWVAIKWPACVLSKTWTLSGWDVPSPLLEGQLEYAALDAAVTFALWRHCIEEKASAVSDSRPE